MTVVFRQTAVRNWPAFAARIRTCSPGRAGPTPCCPISRIPGVRSRGVRPASTGYTQARSRILYEVDDDAATIYIINLGVIP
jgi:hypothetical protein